MLVERIKSDWEDTKKLFRSVPSIVMVLFTLSVIFMNLFANKEIRTGSSYIALDCGFLLSWLVFLCMDMVTKRFGPKAAVKMTVAVALINFAMAGLLAFVAAIPGNWGEYYTYENQIVNDALNSTIGGTWYILLGSMIAFVVSGIVNALVNHGIGKHLKKDNFFAYAIRTYASTMIGQFVDNMCFALIVSRNFFGWTLVQCVVCSLIGAVMELLCEIIFSPIGYSVCKKWEKENVGSEYIALQKVA
ncbi:MAG: VUT family protein [Eubacteriales bacterium]|nr:VUT family protein [Eubacteriales bacterium]